MKPFTKIASVLLGVVAMVHQIVRPLGAEKRINIVINVNHPYWMELSDNNARFYILLSCVYDAVSEWKAGFLFIRLDRDTIKSIKDSLLRVG